MSIDEQVREYMRQWHGGATIAMNGDLLDPSRLSPATLAGRAAYLAAERAERERLEKCPTCGGDTFIDHGALGRSGPQVEVCPACHGTGRRP